MKLSWKREEDKLCIKGVVSLLRKENKINLYKKTKILPMRIKWKIVSSLVKTRTAKQCRERYINQLSPFINRKNWTIEEDNKLKKLFKENSTRWQIIAKQLPGRPVNMVKMRWRVLERALKKKSNSLKTENENENENEQVKVKVKLKECNNVLDSKDYAYFNEIFDRLKTKENNFEFKFEYEAEEIDEMLRK